MKKARILFVFSILVLACVGNAQISSGGMPVSFQMNQADEQFETMALQPPDLIQIGKDDSLASDQFLPRRFCVLLPVGVDLATAGTWTKMPNGSTIWRIRLKSEGALATSLYFKDFKLTDGTKFFIYDETGKQVKGAFTSINNHPSGLFATELIYGDAIILELDCLPSADIPSIQISDIAYAYRDISNTDQVKGFGSSDFCEVNISCSPEGLDWQDEKNGVVRIQVRVSGSGYWCAGSLVNNARNDNTPYVLTADHCAFQMGHYATVSDLNQWLFYFNYESSTCEDPLQEPPVKSMVGASKIAQGGNLGSTGSDFFLMRLNEAVPPEYNPYFLGWSAVDEISSTGVTIHHPEGDIKKISAYNTPLVTVSLPWGGSTLLAHWKVFWTETENGWGVTEPGSSGSPLLNEEGKIIGTLTGGFSACESSGNLGPDKPDYYGKFSYHWQSNGDSDTAQLKPWLDPDNTGITEIDGKILMVKKNNNANEMINIFPNPSSDIVNINFINFEPSALKLVIFDILGRLKKNYYFKTSPNMMMIDISDIPEGVYTIRIDYNQGWMLKKIVKLK